MTLSSMSDLAEIAEAVTSGGLEMICPTMELLVCPNYEDVALKGTGVIRSDDLGRLYFRLISRFDGIPHPALRPSARPGKLRLTEEHVLLRAVDDSGREWRGAPMIVDVSNQIPLPNYRIQKYIPSLLSCTQRRRSDWSTIEIIIPNVPPLPFDMTTAVQRRTRRRKLDMSWAVDYHRHRIGQATVVFRKSGNSLTVVAQRRGAFLPTWPGLMCQALNFATAHTLHPVVITRDFEDRSHLGIYCGPFLRYASYLPQPVYSEDQSARDFWRLIDLFFRYLERNESRAEALLEELEGIRRGSQGSLQTASLTLAVGIESIAKQLLRSRQSESAKRQVASLIRHLNRWHGDARFKERAKGAVGRLADTSTPQLLSAWAKPRGYISLVEKWKRLRNPKAHGVSLREDQAGFDLFYTSVELLYRLLASAMRYSGQIIATSQPGWGEPATEVTTNRISKR